MELHIALQFRNPSMAFIGKDTFIPHFYHVCYQDEILVKIAFLNPIYHENPEILMQKSQEKIDRMLKGF